MLAHLTDLTGSGYAIAALVVFCIAYALVIAEDQIHLRKSKPVIFAAGLIWVLTALAYGSSAEEHLEEHVGPRAIAARRAPRCIREHPSSTC